MNITKYTTTLTQITPLNDYVKLFRLNFPEGKPFHFEAGQFIILNMHDAEGKLHRRSYSIASAPQHTDYVELCIKILPDGRVSSQLDVLQVGDTIEIDGPYGKFTVDKEANKELILVATGVGIAPIRSLLFDLEASKYAQKVSFFFGFRHKQDYLFKDELATLQTSFPQFSFHVCSSQDKVEGVANGRVTDLLAKHVEGNENTMVYICGSLPMVKDVVATVTEKGIERKQIKTDAWG